MGKGGQHVPAPAPSYEPVETKLVEWKSPYDPKDPNGKLPTRGDLKAVIPSHCFERSYFWSVYYVFRDTAWAVGCVYVTSQFNSTDMPSTILNFNLWVLGWTAYSFCMGTIVFGHWVLAHECGHGAFSPSETFNDIVGFVLHQSLLVPYFAWKHTHAKHHRRTNHLVDGETHVPRDKGDVGLADNGECRGFFSVLHEALGDNGYATVTLLLYFLFGWPAYLLGFRAKESLTHDGKPLDGAIADHFRPNSPLFPENLYWKIMASTVAQIGLTGGLLYAGQFHYGHLPVFLWYWTPYIVVNVWLVMYTWLHHTNSSVPHYGSDDWTWMKGALATVDRPYGIFDFFHHRIGSTHVVHHVFHELPWYHAYEATAAVKAYLKPMGLYNYDPTPIPLAMWKVVKECHYVDSRKGIQYYKSFPAKKSKQL